MADRLRTEVGPYVVSTVPLLFAVDGRPWERMVRHPDGGWDDQERFATREEAELDHVTMVARLRALVFLEAPPPAPLPPIEYVTVTGRLAPLPPESVSDVDPELRSLLEVP